MTNKRRVVVTGMGLVSCFGSDIDQFYQRLLQGDSGVVPITSFDCHELPCRIAAPVTGLDTEKYIEKKMDRRLDPYIRYILVSGKRALEHAQLGTEEQRQSLDKTRCGVIVGTAVGGVYTQEVGFRNYLDKGYKRVSPFYCPFILTNMGSALLSIDVGFMGPCYNIATACSTANYCMLAGVNHIRSGAADLMVVGGAEAALFPMSLIGFIACRAVTSQNDRPEEASCPWDTRRDGFVMGDGAGVFVLESLEHALARGAPILAELKGGAINSDAYHMTDPREDGSCVVSCMQKALDDSGLTVDEVDYINAHATSTSAGDLAELRAIQTLFRGKEGRVKINATKSLIGHALGGSGGIEGIVAVKAIETGMLHPTRNLHHPEPELVMDAVPHVAKAHKTDVALSNSFGFGGHNSTIIFARYR